MPMEQFSALRLLVSVVDDGSFTAAAKTLGISTSVVSRQIAALEAELGVTLLKRTTRSVELTHAGNTYINHIRPLLTELNEANSAIRNPNSGAGGRFRVAAPSTIGLSLIAPAIADFMAVNPTIIAHFDLLDRRVDAFEEDYDLALQLGEAPEDAGILAQIEMGLFASPGYCARHNRPHGPSDLPSHRGLFLSSQPAFELRGGSEFQPKQQFMANRLEALKSLCMGGQGIALLPVFLVRREIERAELLQLLDGFEPKPLGLFSVTPQQKRETAATKAFRMFLEARFKRLRL
jgi:DNA-binding transcriptional LysR family regulator